MPSCCNNSSNGEFWHLCYSHTIPLFACSPPSTLFSHSYLIINQLLISDKEISFNKLIMFLYRCGWENKLSPLFGGVKFIFLVDFDESWWDMCLKSYGSHENVVKIDRWLWLKLILIFAKRGKRSGGREWIRDWGLKERSKFTI